MSPRTLNIRNFHFELARTTPFWWAGGISNARGLATIYAPLANKDSFRGKQYVKPETVAELHRRLSWSEQNLVICKPIGWNQGFVKGEAIYFSPNLESFGHPGMDGALGWADPKQELSIGYVMNFISNRIRPPRCARLCQALYACEGLK